MVKTEIYLLKNSAEFDNFQFFTQNICYALLLKMPIYFTSSSQQHWTHCWPYSVVCWSVSQLL